MAGKREYHLFYRHRLSADPLGPAAAGSRAGRFPRAGPQPQPSHRPGATAPRSRRSRRGGAVPARRPRRSQRSRDTARSAAGRLPHPPGDPARRADHRLRGLRTLRAVVEFFVPRRQVEGYGLHVDAIARLSAPGLLVTVDCGITAPEEVAFANTRGLAV